MRRTVSSDRAAVLRVPVRVRPGASRTAVGGVYAGPHGAAVVVAVSAPAVDGRATEATLAAIAGAFGVRRRAVRLVLGAAGRDKLIDIDPAPTDAGRILAELHGRS